MSLSAGSGHHRCTRMIVHGSVRQGRRESCAGSIRNRRGTPCNHTDSTEEVILLSEFDLNRVDTESITRALMDVLPHTKVWVVADGGPDQ